MKYQNIYKHYEDCLEKNGDSHKGVDWPNKKDAELRYFTMLSLLPSQKPISLLDFGCGLSHLYEFMQSSVKYKNIKYYGLDISEKFIEKSQKKFPENTYYHLDILQSDNNDLNFDYIIANGVFTEKLSLTHAEMFDFLTKTLKKLFLMANEGVIFNVMNKHVDWERNDLFHLPYDELADFFHKEKQRNYIIKNDYGLYEYTVCWMKKTNNNILL